MIAYGTAREFLDRVEPARRGCLVLEARVPDMTGLELHKLLKSVVLTLHERDKRSGHCRHCGYDLTANESGVCPQCATPVPKRETTA